jgi:hypothetical protein
MISRIWRRPSPRSRLLIVRHRTYQRQFFDVILKWIAANVPELLGLFDVHDLPVRIRDWSPYALHVPWLQDPVQQWSPEAYDQANRLAVECDARRIPVLNRVDCLINATKSRGAALMRGVGVATPRMAPIDDPREFERTLLGLAPPLFVREDWGHARHSFRVDSEADLRHIPWPMFSRPVGIEIVDVRDPRDGVYRKYRYVAAGDLGVSHHLQSSTEWITRGENRLITPETQDDELRYITRADPNHDALQRARCALGLDLVAFDYGYTPDGKAIVWEANPFPAILFGTRRLIYRNPAIHRTLLAIVRMYLAAAGLPIPALIEDGLAHDFPTISARFKSDFPPTLRERLRNWERQRRKPAA